MLWMLHASFFIGMVADSVVFVCFFFIGMVADLVFVVSVQSSILSRSSSSSVDRHGADPFFVVS